MCTLTRRVADYLKMPGAIQTQIGVYRNNQTAVSALTQIDISQRIINVCCKCLVFDISLLPTLTAGAPSFNTCVFRIQDERAIIKMARRRILDLTNLFLSSIGGA